LRTIGLSACGAALLIAGLVSLYLRSTAQPPDRLLAEARRELARGHYARAEALARQVLVKVPGDGWALLVAAEAAVNQKNTDAALAYYLEAADDGSPQYVSALFGAGEILTHRARLSAAEEKLRQALIRDPHHALSHYRLAFILGITGRRWESVPHLLELVRARQYSAEHLLMLGDVERLANEETLLRSCREAVPDDPLPKLGEARLAIAHNDVRTAASLLREVVAVVPAETEAQARLGMLLLETGLPDEFAGWHRGLPTSADAHPEIWVVRGRWALEHNEPRAAARCFWEAVLRDPDHRLANYRLGQTLNELNEPDRAAPFLSRAQSLQQLATVLDGLFYDRHDTVSMHKAVLLAEPLGRIWETWAWARLGLSHDPTLDWAAETVERLEPLLRPDLPRTLPNHNPARQVDLSSFPLPSWRFPGEYVSRQPAGTSRDSHIHFADIAVDAGIRFVYFNSHESSAPGARLFETTGGGVAAFDYDQDAWPDLYFTQGCRWPADASSRDYRDRLFRNLGDGRAADITDAAGLGDEHYSQGVATGDYNNDGFLDLYVANIGRNRLYRNNGDGTFADVSSAARLRGDSWTTSCLIADLNGDSWPDIYDVTYCTGDKVFSLLCPKDGLLRSCSPRAFDAAPDRVFLSRGDGTFEDVTESSGIDVPNGYGLGIVAADFDGSGHLNLFIANDETANFYFVNETVRRGGKLKFAERALVSGLAFDADGLAQACMGVAAGDANGDGLIDLYVSNFYNESDTLYVQQKGGLFVDMTRQAGLRDPSFAPLGFGTQFIDGELDGLRDLVLTNGHIDDLRAIGQPYEMSPQYFRNLGGGKFHEVASTSLGKFFEGKYLGRGLARLDWDRDGKEDFGISHINSAAALVLNRTEKTGHYLALSLRGITGDRDAIGTSVRVSVGEKTWTQQLTAGDGYQACNERRLVFGLGEAIRIDKLNIHWLSGTEQTFSDVPADAEYIALEGREVLRRIR
jgi:tetratricopeptide (TPR) repeat protein